MGMVLWLTGLSGAGKSTLAERIAPRLKRAGHRVEILDGDAVREHLSRGLGFTREDRRANVLRIAFVAQLLARNGVTVLVAAISPFRDARDEVRQMLMPHFVEIHVATPLEECIRRDPKGLYARAILGELTDFTGVSQSYEPPISPEVRLDTSLMSVDNGASAILSKMDELGYL